MSACRWPTVILSMQKIHGELVETDNVENHPPCPQRKDAALLAKDTTQTRGGPFKRTLITRYGKAHLGRLRFYLCLFEKI